MTIEIRRLLLATAQQIATESLEILTTADQNSTKATIANVIAHNIAALVAINDGFLSTSHCETLANQLLLAREYLKSTQNTLNAHDAALQQTDITGQAANQLEQQP